MWNTNSTDSDRQRRMPANPTITRQIARNMSVSPATVEAVGVAIAITEDSQARTVEERRRIFLQACWRHLGPTQQQHTSIHCQTVASMAGRLGRMQALPEYRLRSLKLAGLLHDIGKCLVSEALLAKPDRLTGDERAVMARHSEIGARIARAIGVDERTAGLIARHHTPFSACTDSTIDADAQLLCVADALVSMMTDRPYCKARPHEHALAELRRCSGSQFAPIAVNLAHRMYRLNSAAA